MRRIAFVLLALVSAPGSAQLLGTAFTYQGTLEVSNVPANGAYDLRFDVYDTPGGPTPIVGSNPVLIDNLDISQGVFTVSLDFGAGVFIGTPVYLEIGVREAAAGGPGQFTGFTSLSPRQTISPAPYALHAESVPFNSIGQDQIADDSITSSDVDSSQIQLRSASMATNCNAAGLAIKTIGTDGSVICDSGPEVVAPLLKSSNQISLPFADEFARKDSAAGNQFFDGFTLFLDYSNNRIGVLNNTPQEAVDVVGTVRADAFALRTNGTGRYNVAGAAFIPSQANSVAYLPNIGGYGVIAGNTGGTVDLTAPVILPVGASVIGLVCRWYDNNMVSNFTEISPTLFVRQEGETGSIAVYEMNSTTAGASTSVTGLSTSGGTSPVVAISDQYFLHVRLTVNTNNSSSLRFYGCGATYSYLTLGR